MTRQYKLICVSDMKVRKKIHPFEESWSLLIYTSGSIIPEVASCKVFHVEFVNIVTNLYGYQSFSVPRALVGKVSTACKTLMEFSLDRMLKYKQACSASQVSLIGNKCKVTMSDRRTLRGLQDAAARLCRM